MKTLIKYIKVSLLALACSVCLSMQAGRPEFNAAIKNGDYARAAQEYSTILARNPKVADEMFKSLNTDQLAALRTALREFRTQPGLGKTAQRGQEALVSQREAQREMARRRKEEERTAAAAARAGGKKEMEKEPVVVPGKKTPLPASPKNFPMDLQQLKELVNKTVNEDAEGWQSAEEVGNYIGEFFRKYAPSPALIQQLNRTLHQLMEDLVAHFEGGEKEIPGTTFNLIKWLYNAIPVGPSKNSITAMTVEIIPDAPMPIDVFVDLIGMPRPAGPARPPSPLRPPVIIPAPGAPAPRPGSVATTPVVRPPAPGSTPGVTIPAPGAPAVVPSSGSTSGSGAGAAAGSGTPVVTKALVDLEKMTPANEAQAKTLLSDLKKVLDAKPALTEPEQEQAVKTMYAIFNQAGDADLATLKTLVGRITPAFRGKRADLNGRLQEIERV